MPQSHIPENTMAYLNHIVYRNCDRLGLLFVDSCKCHRFCSSKDIRHSCQHRVELQERKRRKGNTFFHVRDELISIYFNQCDMPILFYCYVKLCYELCDAMSVKICFYQIFVKNRKLEPLNNITTKIFRIGLTEPVN